MKAIVDYLAILSPTRINYSLILYFIVGPILIFYKKPSMSAKKRLSMLILAIFVPVILLCASLVNQFYINANKAKICSEIEQCNNKKYCSNDNKFGLSKIFQNDNRNELYLLICMLSVIGGPFIGLPELLWRIYYRREIRSIGKNYKGNWLSNLVILTVILFPTIITFENEIGDYIIFGKLVEAPNFVIALMIFSTLSSAINNFQDFISIF